MVRARQCRRARLPRHGGAQKPCSLGLTGRRGGQRATEGHLPIAAPAAPLMFQSRKKPLKNVKLPPHKKNHLEMLRTDFLNNLKIVKFICLHSSFCGGGSLCLSSGFFSGKQGDVAGGAYWRPQSDATYRGFTEQARASLSYSTRMSPSQACPGVSAPSVSAQLLSPPRGATGREVTCATQHTRNGRNVGIIFHDRLH